MSQESWNCWYWNCCCGNDQVIGTCEFILLLHNLWIHSLWTQNKKKICMWPSCSNILLLPLTVTAVMTKWLVLVNLFHCHLSCCYMLMECIWTSKEPLSFESSILNYCCICKYHAFLFLVNHHYCIGCILCISTWLLFELIYFWLILLFTPSPSSRYTPHHSFHHLKY